ncbi:MAG: translation initiation factor IF-2 [Acidobacteriota bacterium]
MADKKVAEKKRIFKLADEIKVEALEIIAYLKTVGIEASAASYLDAEGIQEVKDHFSGKKKPKKAKKAAAEKETAAKATRRKAKTAKEEKEEEPKPPAEAAPKAAESVAAEPKVEEPPRVVEVEVPAPAVKPPEPEQKEEPAAPVAAKPPEPEPAPPPKPEPPPPQRMDPASRPLTPLKPVVPQRPLTAPVARHGGPAAAGSGAPARSGAGAHPRKPAVGGPGETIRQHISSKFGEIRTRPPSTRTAPGQRPPGRFVPSDRPASATPRGPLPPARDQRAPRRTDHHRHYTPSVGRREGRQEAAPRGGPPMIARPVVFQPLPITRSITLTEGVTVKELSEKLDVKAKDIIKRLLDKGIFATMNHALDEKLAIDVSRDFGAEAEIISFEEDIEYEVIAEEKSENVVSRPPVVTIMGHVDHGKTSLLDAIRETNVTSTEAGGITQHIGAYQITKNDRVITFLDTPGHEAFTMMRARGAKVTDIVVLVVAADDGVMPQTLEAIDHSHAAKVPIVVAINKIDKPNAQVDKVKKALSEHGLLAEDWGGQTVTVEVSAKMKTNLDLLLEMILLVADLQGIKANPHRTAMGTILEAKLDKGRGPVATVLVQNGTLEVGDPFIVGPVTGKVRAMFDHLGEAVKSAGPSTPVEVLGLQAVPQAGDLFQVMADASKAKQISSLRQLRLRESQLAKTARLTLEHLHEQLKTGTVKELPLILKADVQGSVEVLSETLAKLSNEKVKVKIIHKATGAITETDVLLASASNAIIIGFNVRPERKAADLAEQEGVDVRLHTVIYNITNEIKSAMVGMLDQTFKEVRQGSAEVRNIFKVPKVGNVAGCYVSDGKITRNSQVRLLRDNVVVYEGKIASLKRFKDDAAEVRSGFECGIGLSNFNDIKNGDVIEAFVMEKVAVEVP